MAGNQIIPDGTLRDEFNLRRGFWEAKDTSDNLDKEISKKKAKKYPLSNTIFEDTRTAVLYQNGTEADRYDLTNPQAVADLLNQFYSHVEPEIENFDTAVNDFKDRVPYPAKSLLAKLKKDHMKNKTFQEAFKEYFSHYLAWRPSPPQHACKACIIEEDFQLLIFSVRDM